MSGQTAESAIGATEAGSERIAGSIAQAFSATLDYATALHTGDPLPPLWHWLYFWPKARMSAIGEDGHPTKGGFLPELGLPRRMAAGGRFTFHAALKIDGMAQRSSRVTRIERKEGRSGRLAFVTVAHTITGNGKPAIYEEQDIVYREAATGGRPPPPVPAPKDSRWRRQIRPSEALLFRYSALTFNAHRIHYDRAYARDVEGYADLVVHGPLVATLLAELVRRELPDRKILTYEYRARRPLFLGNDFSVCGRLTDDGGAAELWAQDHEGWLTMSARASLG